MKQRIIDLYNKWYYHNIAGCDTSCTDLAALAKIATEIKTSLASIEDSDSPSVKFKKYTNIRSLMVSFYVKKSSFAKERFSNDTFLDEYNWLNNPELDIFMRPFAYEFAKQILARSFIEADDADPDATFINQITTVCNFNEEVIAGCSHSLATLACFINANDKILLSLILNQVPLTDTSIRELMSLAICADQFESFQLITSYLLKNRRDIDFFPICLTACFTAYHSKLAAKIQVIQYLLKQGLGLNKEYTVWDSLFDKNKKLTPYYYAEGKSAEPEILKLLTPVQQHTTTDDKSANTNLQQASPNIVVGQKGQDENLSTLSFDQIKVAILQGGIAEQETLPPSRLLGLLVENLGSLTDDNIETLLKCYHEAYPNEKLTHCTISHRYLPDSIEELNLIEVLIERYHNQPHPSVLRLMSEAIKQIDASATKNRFNSALEIGLTKAIYNDSPEVVSIILSANIYPTDKAYGVICSAGNAGSIKIFKHLLATFDRLDTSNEGIDSLFSCLNENMLPYLDDLRPELENKGFRPALKNEQGDTALCYVIKKDDITFLSSTDNDNFNVVQWLINNYPESLDGIHGVNALTTAVSSEHPAIIALLLDKRVSPYARHNNGKSAFMVARALNNSDTTNRIYRLLENQQTIADRQSKPSSFPVYYDDEESDQGPSSGRRVDNDANQIPKKSSAQGEAGDESEPDSYSFDLGPGLSDSEGTEDISLPDSQALTSIKESVDQAITSYLKYNKYPQGFFHHHGGSGRKRASALLQDIKSSESIEAVMNILQTHFSRTEKHRICFWRPKGGNLYNHSLDTYLMAKLENNEDFNKFILNGDNIFRQLNTYQDRLAARTKFCGMN